MKTYMPRIVFPFILFVLLPACTTTSRAKKLDTEAIRDEIRTVMARQQEAWNRGDIDAFMQDYWNSDSLTFASSGTVRNGWNETIARYKSSYPDRATMGNLTFTLFDIRVFSPREAFVFGRFELKRESDRPSGFFTLLFRNFSGDWKIVFDHTSSDP